MAYDGPWPASVRLVATDLDGTLLRADDTVGSRTTAAIAALSGVGIELVFVTGRPPRWLPPVAEATGHVGTALCANGAVTVDLHDEVVTAVSPLSPEAGREVVRRLRGIDPGVTFAVEHARVGDPLTGGGIALGTGYRERWPVPEGTVRAPIEQLVERDDLSKVLVRAPEASGHGADAFLAAAAERLAGVVEVTHSMSSSVLLEISALGVDKGSGLAALAAARGIGADAVVAVGDMPNDLPMLRWAGLGLAVGNAHDAVLAAADGTLAHHDDEGVADLLEALAEAVAGPRGHGV